MGTKVVSWNTTTVPKGTKVAKEKMSRQAVAQGELLFQVEGLWVQFRASQWLIGSCVALRGSGDPALAQQRDKGERECPKS